MSPLDYFDQDLVAPQVGSFGSAIWLGLVELSSPNTRSAHSLQAIHFQLKSPANVTIFVWLNLLFALIPFLGLTTLLVVMQV